MSLIEPSPVALKAYRWASPAHLATEFGHGAWTPARHLRFIASTIRDRVIAGSARLILTVPPRHGKSKLCSVWLPAWLLTLRPDARVGVVGYGIGFTTRWGREVRAIIREHGPDLGLTIDPEKKAANEFELLEGGSMLCTGIEGTMTGLGFDLLIVDDPHKDRSEAESDILRQKVIDWWQSTALTRLEPEASVVVLMQRWREDDLVGFLLSEESGEAWEIINLPALAEEGDVLGREVGEPLWPERYPREAMEARRIATNPYNWASQYQQRPAPAGGTVFHSQDFRYFTEDATHYHLLGENDRRYRKANCWIGQTIDTAWSSKNQADWTVCLTFAVCPDKSLLVLDVVRARLEMPDQMGFLDVARAKHNPRWQAVEDAAAGKGLIQIAQRMGRPFKILKADRDKVQRCDSAAIMYGNHMIYHKRGEPWLGDFEAELLTFPHGGKHDDQVDCLAYACLETVTPETQFVGWF